MTSGVAPIRGQSDKAWMGQCTGSALFGPTVGGESLEFDIQSSMLSGQPRSTYGTRCVTVNLRSVVSDCVHAARGSRVRRKKSCHVSQITNHGIVIVKLKWCRVNVNARATGVLPTTYDMNNVSARVCSTPTTTQANLIITICLTTSSL